MMKRFLTLNELMHKQGLSAAALAEMDSQSDWRCHKKTALHEFRLENKITTQKHEHASY